MITFSKLGIYGRLGNQLFQCAILISLRERFGYEIKLPELKQRVWHGQKNLLENFKFKYANLEKTDVIEYKFEEIGDYDESVFEIKDNTDLNGYFGNFKYFKEFSEVVKKELTPNESTMIKSQSVIDEIKKKYPEFKIISLHIRRGDTDLSIYADSQSSYFKYLDLAKKEFNEDRCKFLIFTGGNRNDETNSDYEWCKRNFNTDEYIFTDLTNETMFDFCCMLCCDGHILAPTSTLSWWVGFLTDSNKKIIAPKKYKFLKSNSPDGFYPDNFKLI